MTTEGEPMSGETQDVGLTPDQTRRFTEAAERGLAPRRAILLLAQHATGHRRDPHGDWCETCRTTELWPCQTVLRAASPALRAVENLTLGARVAGERERANTAEAKIAAVETLRDEWDEEALQAWRDADRTHCGDVIADQVSRRAERLRAALDTPREDQP